MSDTQNAVDTATQPVAGSTPVAPPNTAGDTQGSTPAPEVTSAPDTAKPEAQEPDKQSRREARAYATLRRENRELYRRLGGMEAVLAQLGQPQKTTEEGDPPPQQQRRTTSPELDEAMADLNRSIVERIEDAGEEYEEVVEKITAKTFPMTVAMRDFLATSENPALVAKALADDPKEARRISLLSDRAADRAMERVESRVKTAAKPPPRNSTAPPPVPTVGGRSAPSFDPNKASMDEYAAEWKRRQAAK